MLHRAFPRAWLNQVTYANIYKSSTINNGQTVCWRRPPTTTSWQSRQQHRSFRTSKATRSNINPTPIESEAAGPVPRKNIMKAIIFTGTFSLGCYVGATIMEYENTRSLIIAKAKQARFNFWSRPSAERGSWAQIKNDIKRQWDTLGPGEKVFVPICALNLIVFGLWRMPSMRNTMLTYFTSNPAARIVCWPMFLSTFSHYSALHIFANMYVLHSFSNAAAMSLGKEQFLALYLSGGVISSLTSVLYKTVTTQAGISLGASGAIMAILAYVCAQYPDTQLSILFLPTLTFSAGSAIKVIMGIDFAGCMLGWKFFDHAAHLGGAAFGLFWAYFGAQIWSKRISLLNHYHDMRKTKDK